MSTPTIQNTQNIQKTTTLTPEEMWQLFQEESRQRHQEWERRDKEWERRRQEWERRDKEWERSREERERRDKEWEQIRKELAEQMKRTDEQMKRTDQQLGKLGNHFGEMIEHLVAPGIADKFNELGYHFHEVARSFKCEDETGRTLAEVDFLLENDEFIIAGEVKAKPLVADIADHICRLKILKEHFKKYRGYEKKIVGALAGAIFAENVKNTAIRQGIYVIVQTGDTIKIDVPNDFQPKTF
ncbi:MAG: hypothetical protein LBQ50_12075 [Planctomycetaceae bacterium]|jgi:hypothetical protein|nr:hypothetical protein [Planctomycetaceae bacterium]